MPASPSKIVAFALLFIISAIWLIPTVGLLVASVRPLAEIRGGWWNFTPPPTIVLENFVTAWNRGIEAHFINSVIITVPATLIPLFVGALAAYAFTSLRFPRRDAMFFLFVASIIVPAQIVLVPLLKLLLDLGLNNTFLGIILVHTGFGLPFIIFVLRNFFAQIPTDLIDAARVDGGSEFGIFWRIILPLAIPALAALFILQYLFVWNDLLFALTFLQSKSTQPITVGLVNLQGRFAPEWNLLSAGSLISVITPLAIFLLLQKYFVSGLTAGALKG